MKNLADFREKKRLSKLEKIYSTFLHVYLALNVAVKVVIKGPKVTVVVGSSSSEGLLGPGNPDLQPHLKLCS